MIRYLTPLVARVAGVAAVIILLGIAIAANGSASASGTTDPDGKLNSQRVEERMPGFDGAVAWLNSEPLTATQLRGKVVLVDFWTYSCINCIRTIPYIRAWAEKYRDDGLVVVGVHSPEFAFEGNFDNVKAAIDRFKIDFPVAVDSNHRIWNEFGNRAWPAYHFIDAQGRLRHRQYGEGNYEKAEQVIQALLAEARSAKPKTGLVSPEGRGEQAAPDARHIRSEETYVGYAQAARFRSPETIKENMPQQYTVGKLRLNEWGLAGNWTVGPDRAVLGQADGSIAYRFSARDLHLVLGPGASGKSVRFQVRIDGRAPGPDHGTDIDAEGNGVLTQTRLYQLVRQSGNVKERTVEIRFFSPGAEAFAFTFG